MACFAAVGIAIRTVLGEDQWLTAAFGPQDSGIDPCPWQVEVVEPAQAVGRRAPGQCLPALAGSDPGVRLADGVGQGEVDIDAGFTHHDTASEKEGQESLDSVGGGLGWG
jgi:hypothetical protein